MVCSCKSDHERKSLQDSVLYSALSCALEGSAAQWLTQVLVGRDITWTKFKDLYTARFGGKEIATSAFMKMLMKNH